MNQLRTLLPDAGALLVSCKALALPSSAAHAVGVPPAAAEEDYFVHILALGAVRTAVSLPANSGSPSRAGRSLRRAEARSSRPAGPLVRFLRRLRPELRYERVILNPTPRAGWAACHRLSPCKIPTGPCESGSCGVRGPRPGAAMYFLTGKKYQKPNARSKLRAPRLRLLNEYERLRFSHIRSGRSRCARRSFRNFNSAFLRLLRGGVSARASEFPMNRALQEPAGRSLRPAEARILRCLLRRLRPDAATRKRAMLPAVCLCSPLAHPAPRAGRAEASAGGGPQFLCVAGAPRRLRPELGTHSLRFPTEAPPEGGVAEQVPLLLLRLGNPSELDCSRLLPAVWGGVRLVNAAKGREHTTD